MLLEAVKKGIIVALIGVSLAACGTRGSLENPAAEDNSATAASGQGKPAGEAPRPHRGFVLDGLIR